MIHMTANLTVSAFYKKAGWPRWRAFAVPLAGLFQLICPSVSDTIFVTFKFTILRLGTEFLLYKHSSGQVIYLIRMQYLYRTLHDKLHYSAFHTDS
jgi:hypothetical protein